MASTSKKKASTARKKKPASLVIFEQEGYWLWAALDKDGKEVERGGDGSRNRHYTRRLALEAHPDLPVA